jgi:CHRD domain-containing protein
MKYGLLALVCTFVALPALADVDHEREGNKLRAHLRAIKEVPSVATNASGEFTAEIAKDESSISFELSFENLSANLAAAHIHIGQFFANGGVSAFLCGGGGQPACPAATSGTITGTITAANVVGPAAQGVAAGNLAALIEEIRDGVTYANMHNAAFPAGESRGRVEVHD